ncbi:MAG: glycoside hydrolase family 3 protein [Lachnospiraceae bacterium]|nr:glycoside hydrolase family 3 protein [Lachnospiraceae bacterium]
MEKYLDESLSFEERAKDLASRLTLEEKVYQTLHAAPAIDRLGIRSYNYWNEALHGVARAGVATVFPQAIGLAAAFDEDFMEEIADCISTEGRAKFNVQQKYGDTDIYKGLTFWSPNVNIFRDPRWGRGHETFGEDPYLTSRLGVRFINGIQGHDERYLKAAACAKHFAVHSGPEDERHSFDAVASAKDMRETYLPAFKACVKEADVEVVMGAYNRTNGEPCCGSKTLLNDILREEWGFEGHVTSDCWAIKDFHEFHMVTSGPAESVALAMNNGCDLNCGNINGNLIQAKEQGLITEETIEQSVARLFATRMKLGLFDKPEHVPFNDIPYEVVDCNEHRVLNLRAAEKVLCLLKNDNNILPLDKTKINTIGVIGPNADNRRSLVGNYEGTASEYVTILDGIREYLGDDVRVMYSEGCHICRKKISGLATNDNDRLSEAKAVADASDVVIACFGLDPSLEGEEGDQGNEFASGDKPNLELPGVQLDVLKAIYESGKPVILVLLSGSALAVKWADEHIPAIVQGWYPGAQGGRAIARMLFGDVNPEGKLPVTFYNSSEELPDFKDYSMKGRTYRYMKNEALYPFGYGLSYSEYNISDVSVDAYSISHEKGINVSAVVSNVGTYDGAETVQVYVRVNKDDAPNWQLKGLKKVSLNKGESKQVNIELKPEDFGIYCDDGVKVLYNGTFEVFVGTCQPDSRSISLTGKTPVKFEVSYNGDDAVIME